MNKWAKKYFPFLQENCRQTQLEAMTVGAESIQLADLWPAFMLLVGGIILASLILIAECLICRTH